MGTGEALPFAGLRRMRPALWVDRFPWKLSRSSAFDGPGNDVDGMDTMSRETLVGFHLIGYERIFPLGSSLPNPSG